MTGHNAAAATSGYIYQTDWALMDLLRKGQTRPDQAITLELHDDVAWVDVDNTGDPVELLQVKLHTTSKAAGLGDMAVDIWKTVRIWLDRSDTGDPQGPDLHLVTTSVATEGTAAYALRPSTRDVDLAVDLLTKAAASSTNEITENARAAFLALDQSVRRSLLHRAWVLDGQMPPEDLDVAVREALTYALPSGGPPAHDSFVAQVWHYWRSVAIDMLAGRRSMTSVTEVQTFVRELRDRYTTENLPTTVRLGSVTDEHIGLYGQARFVAQLALVEYSGPSLRNAIIDYHRAVTQETAWLSDSLLDVQELRNFEAELRFEWTREFEAMVQDLGLDALSPEDAEATKVRAGRKLLNYLLNSTAVTVRTYYNDGFYGRGKRHELAGHEDTDQRIGWHPDFIEHLEAITTSV
ncbi:MAG: hypothetical protein JWQ81_2699 [Amycolatopsis sp.]|uniref:ABC-three component system protein n=1 Tax=Amycolatopsis sp. TaxID=37632 RepID=UPI002622C88C|nr:ABC-three component system protein [Amycolatopsis sp.]MCU1681960.1 hypothetical protein [Amycolatopsis sp.]